MLSYCLRCRKNTDGKNPKVVRTKKGKNNAFIKMCKWNYQNKLDKAWFQHHMVYEDFKYLSRRTLFDNILRDKSFNFAKNQKYDGYHCGKTSMVYKFFDSGGRYS